MVVLHSRWSFVRSFVLTTLGALGAVGCALDTQQDAEDGARKVEPIGETSSELTWTGGAKNSVYGTYIGTLGPSDTETCFLTGVWGDFQSLYRNPGNGQEARVEVYPNSAGLNEVRWQSGSTTLEVGGSVACIRATGHRTAPVYYTGGAPVALGFAFGGRRCFLTSVINLAAHDDPDQNFATAGDTVRVYESRNEWYIGGSGHAQGAAVCVDVNTFLGAAGAVDTQEADVPLGRTQKGEQCFLTEFGGALQAQTLQGVVITHEGPNWALIVGAGLTGIAECDL